MIDPEGPQTDEAKIDEFPTDMPPGRFPGSDTAVIDEGA